MRKVSEIQELIIDQQELIDNQPNGTTVEKKEVLRLNREMNELKKELEEAEAEEIQAEKADKLRKSAQAVARPLVEGATIDLKIKATQVAKPLIDSRGITHVSRVHTMEDGSTVWVRIAEGTLTDPTTLVPVEGNEYDAKKHTHLTIQCRKAKADNNLYWNWLSYSEDPVLVAKTRTSIDKLADVRAKMELLASFDPSLQESMVKLLLAS